MPPTYGGTFLCDNRVPEFERHFCTSGVVFTATGPRPTVCSCGKALIDEVCPCGRTWTVEEAQAAQDRIWCSEGKHFWGLLAVKVNGRRLSRCRRAHCSLTARRSRRLVDKAHKAINARDARFRAQFGMPLGARWYSGYGGEHQHVVMSTVGSINTLW